MKSTKNRVKCYKTSWRRLAKILLLCLFLIWTVYCGQSRLIPNFCQSNAHSNYQLVMIDKKCWQMPTFTIYKKIVPICYQWIIRNLLDYQRLSWWMWKSFWDGRRNVLGSNRPVQLMSLKTSSTLYISCCDPECIFTYINFQINICYLEYLGKKKQHRAMSFHYIFLVNLFLLNLYFPFKHPVALRSASVCWFGHQPSSHFH